MPDPDIQPDAKAIRNSIRRLRREIPEADRISASARICQTFKTLDAFQAASRISGFLAFDGEADPLPLMTWASEMKRQVFVPIIIAKRQPLLFSPWHPAIPMRINSFGIAEPDVPNDQWIEPRELDFVITPIVAFDENCHRIGVGGGYYDRSFAFLNSRYPDHSRRPVMIGFAFELQRVKTMIRQPWDVQLDAIVTERQIYYRKDDADPV